MNEMGHSDLMTKSYILSPDVALLHGGF